MYTLRRGGVNRWGQKKLTRWCALRVQGRVHRIVALRTPPRAAPRCVYTVCTYTSGGVRTRPPGQILGCFTYMREEEGAGRFIGGQ